MSDTYEYIELGEGTIYNLLAQGYLEASVVITCKRVLLDLLWQRIFEINFGISD